MNSIAEGIGATAGSIQYHYDLSNDFYREWLDSSMTYSSALWLDGIDKKDLEQAQKAKLDWHLNRAGLSHGGRLLDIGCGWGSLIRSHMANPDAVAADGLTLSDAQADYVENLELDRVKILRHSWLNHQSAELYDGIISIGAFEHFAKPGITSKHKIKVYREFFKKCKDLLKPGGYVSLQTIAYGNLNEENKNIFTQNEIFPDSELPRPFEIFAASDGLFEITEYRNDRTHYGRTCDLWLRELKRKKPKIIADYGHNTYDKYVKYLKLVTTGFYLGQMVLLRIQLKSL
jgi:cyclopropane-fatty-acyl-phospholipid synthase